jgi:hypothetical protein
VRQRNGPREKIEGQGCHILVIILPIVKELAHYLSFTEQKTKSVDHHGQRPLPNV